MKHILLLALLISLPLALVTSTAFAAVISADESVVLAAEETIADDYFAAGDSVTINGTVNGDVYVAGGNITITGHVLGDILAAGGVVNITGIVDNDVRTAGGNILFNNAKIGGSVTAMGGTLTFDSETKIEGGLVIGAGLVTNDAEINRGITGGAGSITLGGKTGGDIIIGTEQFVIASQTIVAGDVTYYSEQDASIDKTAQIMGKVSRMDPPLPDSPTKMETDQFFDQFSLGAKIVSYLSVFLLGVLIIRFFNPTFQVISSNIKEKPWSSLLWGVVAFFITPPFLLLLMVTVIGIPLALILGVAFIIALYTAKIFVGGLLGLWLADVMNNQDINKYVMFGLGLALYYIVASIPVLGFFVATASVLFGLGATLLAGRDFFNKD